MWEDHRQPGSYPENGVLSGLPTIRTSADCHNATGIRIESLNGDIVQALTGQGGEGGFRRTFLHTCAELQGIEEKVLGEPCTYEHQHPSFLGWRSERTNWRPAGLISEQDSLSSVGRSVTWFGHP